MKVWCRNVYWVARREFVTIIMTKGFLAMLLIPLLFLFLASALPKLAERMMTQAKKNRTESIRVGVLGTDPASLESWRKELQNQKLDNGKLLFELQSMSVIGVPLETLEEKAREKLLAKEWEAYVVLRGDIAHDGQCDLYNTRGFDITLPQILSRTLRTVVREQRLVAEGLDPARIARLNRGISWNQFEVMPVTVTGQKSEQRKAGFEKTFIPAMICIMMMFFLTFTTSQRMLRGIVEEKTTRVVEVLLSSLSPTELLAGKVAGFYLVGLVQFAVWVGFGLVVLHLGSISPGEYIPAGYFLQFLVFLTTGYLFYAAIFAAIGAMVGDETESQQLQGMITVVIILPLMFNFILITQPNWWLVRLIGAIPFFTPTVMAVRMVATEIPWWETSLLALSTTVFAILGVRLAARIFHVGILMTGKRPGLRELWRWCRYREPSGIQDA